MRNNKQEKPKRTKVIVTRALSQAKPLLQRLIASGFETFHLPTIEIQPPDDEGKELRDSIQNLATYDWIILTSSNGKLWTNRNSGTLEFLTGIEFASSLFVIVGSKGTILTSSDGEIWTTRNSEIRNHLLNVTYGKENFVVVGDKGSILTSRDGISWNKVSIPTSLPLIGLTYSIISN